MNFRGYALTIWETLDPLYYTFTRLTYLDKDKEEPCIFRVRLTRYKGRSLTLNDGTTITKNDVLVKIHLHNVRLLRTMANQNNDLYKARHLYRLVQKSLPNVAEYVQKHSDFGQIKGIIGITLLNKGCHRLGFETFSIKSKIYRLFKLSALYPIFLLSSSRSTQSLKIPDPTYLIMTREQLLERYQQ
ncbi:hypothetical protein [Alkalihalobacillus sp. AL-G]|uniref:YkoP family protein n=1 Tax=Alkalihalobacillus sp. AL-G TaxID=2926399 RepID=UPI00272A925F|nr:hypothetical protein [Alkalihalobacillus sp. AL-G]WLD91557.1 hypothetical protein MOJ78_10910 [Alkalihalobacillus sp. AL-G]